MKAKFDKYTKKVVAEITDDEVIPATDYEIILIPNEINIYYPLEGKDHCHNYLYLEFDH